MTALASDEDISPAWEETISHVRAIVREAGISHEDQEDVIFKVQEACQHKSYI